LAEKVLSIPQAILAFKSIGNAATSVLVTVTEYCDINDPDISSIHHHHQFICSIQYNEKQ